MRVLALNVSVAISALVLSACADQSADKASAAIAETQDCSQPAMIGRFDPALDLLVANYDSKPDVDDLHAVASLGSVLQHPDFACVDFIATHGAYGIQTGEFMPAADLFTLAFGTKWIDAHAKREEAIAKLAQRMQTALAQGGKVWIAEAGQSDVSAEAVKRLPEGMWRGVNIVQHSYWNESQTSSDAMNTVVYNTTYHRIQDGNFPENGTPDFNTDDSAAWETLLVHPTLGPVWTEAKRLSDKHNPVAEYVNPAVEKGGLDFSDTAEIAYIFGFEDMVGVDEFVERFAQ